MRPTRSGAQSDFQISGIVEKPTQEEAPSRLAVAARYIFNPEIFAALRRTSPGYGGELELTDAIATLIKMGYKVRCLRLKQDEVRYDIGSSISYFKAFIDFSLSDQRHGYLLRQYLQQRFAGVLAMARTYLSTAPGRAGIVGNPTDMYGGSVISCSTKERSAVLIDPAKELSFEVAGRKHVVQTPADLNLDGGYFDVAKAVIDFLNLADARFSLRWACDVPFGAGLSSSSSMIVAILNAVLAYIGREEHIFFRAEMARHIELHYLVLCGYQDAYMCTLGGLNYMDFRQKQFYRALGDEPYATMESLTPYIDEFPFVLAHTGVQRSSGLVHRPIRERWLKGDREVVREYLPDRPSGTNG